jgi:fatty acid synthase subunit alpha, fungi type
MAGLLQSVITGIIPGNRNSKCVPKVNERHGIMLIPPSSIDAHFQDRRFLMFPSKLIHTDGVHTGIMVCLSLLLARPLTPI